MNERSRSCLGLFLKDSENWPKGGGDSRRALSRGCNTSSGMGEWRRLGYRGEAVSSSRTWRWRMKQSQSYGALKANERVDIRLASAHQLSQNGEHGAEQADHKWWGGMANAGKVTLLVPITVFKTSWGYIASVWPVHLNLYIGSIAQEKSERFSSKNFTPLQGK